MQRGLRCEYAQYLNGKLFQAPHTQNVCGSVGYRKVCLTTPKCFLLRGPHCRRRAIAQMRRSVQQNMFS